jgi:hypothetical protein
MKLNILLVPTSPHLPASGVGELLGNEERRLAKPSNHFLSFPLMGKRQKIKAAEPMPE